MLLKAVAQLLSGTLLVACATTEPIALQVAVPPTPGVTPIARPVAFVHPAAFRENQKKIHPYGSGYELTLNVGEASDKALREVYPRLFASVREVQSPAELGGLTGPDAPQAILVPSVLSLNYLNASRRLEGPHYAQIEYRFTLKDTQGALLGNWVLRGFGQYDVNVDAKTRTKDSPPAPRGEAAMGAEAPRRAVEAAIAAFGSTLDRVPEIIRWRHGRTVLGTNVPGESQVTRMGGSARPGIEAEYAGVFTLRIERAPVPSPPKGLVEEPTREANLVALRITLANLSARRLALDPAEIAWEVGSNAPLAPLPVPIVAAFVTRLPFGLTVAPGTGVAAIPALIAALASAAEIERHRKEFDAWTTAVAGDVYADGLVSGGKARSGLIYFAKPADPDSGTLTLPVVDLDDALRYTVRVPMPKS